MMKLLCPNCQVELKEDQQYKMWHCPQCTDNWHATHCKIAELCIPALDELGEVNYRFAENNHFQGGMIILGLVIFLRDDEWTELLLPPVPITDDFIEMATERVKKAITEWVSALYV
jgi:hypothetical protein